MVANLTTSPTTEPTLREKIRAHYIECDERPSWTELAEQFGVKEGTIKNWASDEGWPAMRLAHQETLAKKSDALSVIIQAAKSDSRVSEAYANFALIGLNKLTRVLMDLKDEAAPSSRAGVINTCSFGALNIANGAKAIGIVGMPKGIADAGKEDNGRWNPGLLSQINLTINGMAAKVDAEQKAAGQNSAPAQAQPVETDETPLG